jgi:hypothetical protein
MIDPPVKARKLKKVPFVELYGGRLQGVVSSGSDIARVYVSFFDAATHNYYCSTNNNRPCGGLRGRPCKHLLNLLDEALLQYGPERVARYFKLATLPEQIKKGSDLLVHMSGSMVKEPAATVFSRFLNHLSFLEYAGSVDAVPEMEWFSFGEIF